MQLARLQKLFEKQKSIHLSPPEDLFGLNSLSSLEISLQAYTSLLTVWPLSPSSPSEFSVIPQGVDSRKLKQQRWRWLRKHHLKSEFALLQSLLHLFQLVYFVKRWQMFLEQNSKGLYQSSGKEKESCCLVFPSLTKRTFWHFHVVVGQRLQRNVVPKMMKSCCLANLNPLLFCCSRCCCHHHCLRSLMF